MPNGPPTKAHVDEYLAGLAKTTSEAFEMFEEVKGVLKARRIV